MQPNETDVEKEASLVSELYDLNKASLLCERKIVATAISVNKKENVLSATYELIKWQFEDRIGEILPTYKAAAKILAAIPATSCSAERSFSALRRIKTYLKNTMGEQRLSNIAILSIERETTNFVEENMMDIIIDEFAKKNDDRARLLCHK